MRVQHPLSSNHHRSQHPLPKAVLDWPSGPENSDLHRYLDPNFPSRRTGKIWWGFFRSLSIRAFLSEEREEEEFRIMYGSLQALNGPEFGSTF